VDDFERYLSNVENLTIGFERIGATGGEGAILLDDISCTSFPRMR
jgi:hypothetical protein